MNSGRLSRERLGRMHDVMAGYVERGELPGLVTLVSRRGEVHVDAIGMKAVGGSDPMRRDTIFRIASMTKPPPASGHPRPRRRGSWWRNARCGWTSRWIGGFPNWPTAKCCSGSTGLFPKGRSILDEQRTGD
jgi:hypothetical protein